MEIASGISSEELFGKFKVKTGVLRQFFAAFFASLAIASVSSAFVWIAPLQVRLKSPNDELFLTGDEASWIVSLIEVGDLLSTIPAGFLVDAVGRKPMLLATGPILLFSWLLVLLTRSLWVLYLARIIQGVALGMVFVTLPLYLAEVAGIEIRGRLGYFFQGMWYVGNLYEYSIGPFLSYDSVAYLSMIIPLVFVVSFSWFPESPYLLFMKGREGEAEKALAWFRGTTEIQEEMGKLRESVEAERNSSWKDLVRTRAGHKGLFLVHLVGATYTLSGGTAMFSYATDTFAKAGSRAWADYYTIALGSVVLGCVPVSGRLSDNWGRRPVMLASCLGGFLSLAAVAVFFALGPSRAPGWLPLAGFISYAVSIGAGIEAVFPVLQAEFFPSNTRGVASGLSHFNLTLLSFLVLKMYQVVGDGLGLHVLFSVFASCSLVGAALIFFLVPETKGKRFEEIQQLLT